MSKALSLLEKARRYLRTDAEQLARLAEAPDPGLPRATELICVAVRSGHKLVFTGMGKSYHIAAKCAATFTSTGSPAVLLHPAEAPHGDLGLVADGDVVLLLSYSGESPEVVRLVPLLRRARTALISITGSPDNRLAALCDLNLCVAIEKEACPFNLAPTTSALVTLALCDTLAMLAHEELGFTREAYQRLHPGGAIGDSLGMRVRDIMRGGERLPLCGPQDSLRDAVLAMTRRKAGAVGVVDADGRLIGIYTDGDLRRSLATVADLQSARLEDHMTRKPITIAPEALASEALRCFERHNIDDLLVVDAEGKPVGMVDLQDIPKLKLFKDN